MKKRASIAVCCVAFLLLLFSCSSNLSSISKSGNNGKKSKKKASKTVSASDLPMLSLDDLTPGDQKNGESSRNLFAFEQDPAILAQKKKEAEKIAENRKKAAKKIAEVNRQQAENLKKNPPKPTPPPITFKFIGYFGNPEKKIGVFASSSGDDLYLARTGDTLMGRFKILDIGYESAEIGFKNFDETKRIPLGGA